MFSASLKWVSARSLLLRLSSAVLIAWAAPLASAQEQTPTPTPTPTPAVTREQVTTSTPAATPTPAAQPTPTPAPQPSEPAAEPLFRDYKGVTLGMSIDDVRRKLGKPEEPDKTQDIFVLSEDERVRVYYDESGKATAVIVTYIGKSAAAPEPKAVIGIDIEAKEGGTMYKMVTYPAAGYWVSYSRTAGDQPFVTVSMQKATP